MPGIGNMGGFRWNFLARVFVVAAVKKGVGRQALARQRRSVQVCRRHVRPMEMPFRLNHDTVLYDYVRDIFSSFFSFVRLEVLSLGSESSEAVRL